MIGRKAALNATFLPRLVSMHLLRETGLGMVGLVGSGNYNKADSVKTYAMKKVHRCAKF